MVHRKVTYHDACHLFHGQKVKQQPSRIITSNWQNLVTDNQYEESDWCCGSASIHNTKPEMASQLLERKMNNIFATGFNVVVTGNPGCMMQIAFRAQAKGYELAVMHPIQLLDKIYQVKGIYEVAVTKRDSIRNRGRHTVDGTYTKYT